jgi:3-methyladenine DNA glycosylase AlkD
MEQILHNLRQELKSLADDVTRKSGLRFFKEDVMLYGVKSVKVDQIGREYFKLIQDKGKKEVFTLCENLWQSGFLEESFIACHWSWYVRKEYSPGDIDVFEKWIGTYINNWASCDTLCNHSVGELVKKFPDCLADLKKWAHSSNRWMKRAAAVSLIIPARKGFFLNDIFEIAGILLMDKDDMVQKGYGWMLKAASQAHQEEVFEYVLSVKDRMPRTSLRYAIEKMPAELRSQAMKK